MIFVGKNWLRIFFCLSLRTLNSLTHPHPQNLQNSFTPKLDEQGTWNFKRMFTYLHVSQKSHVMCHMSCVTYHVSLVTFILNFLRGKVIWLRVCYQQGLPCLFLKQLTFFLQIRARPWQVFKHFVHRLINLLSHPLP